MGKGKGRLLTFFPSFHRLWNDPEGSPKGWLWQTLKLGGKQGSTAKSKLLPDPCQKKSLKSGLVHSCWNDLQDFFFFARVWSISYSKSSAFLGGFLHRETLSEIEGDAFYFKPQCPELLNLAGAHRLFSLVHLISALQHFGWDKVRDHSPRHPRKMCRFCFANCLDVP